MEIAMVWYQLNQQQAEAIRELEEQAGSERIVAVVGGALLDQSLQVALALRMRPDKDATRKLFRASGPLAGANKVDLAYLLYMFEKPTRDAILAIFAIRNLFAHNLSMSFDSKHPDMVDKLKCLTLHRERSNYPDPLDTGSLDDSPIGEIHSNKETFLANLKIALILLGRDHNAHLPYQNTPV